MTGGCIDIWDYFSAFFNWFGRSGDWWDQAVSFFSFELISVVQIKPCP
jgi:hypothetical protein